MSRLSFIPSALFSLPFFSSPICTLLSAALDAMNREELRKAQQKSRSEFLRREAERRQRAASSVVQQELRDVAQGILPASVTEADFLLKRSEEVRTAGDLLHVGRRRQELAVGASTTVDETMAPLLSGVDAVVEEGLFLQNQNRGETESTTGISASTLPAVGAESLSSTATAFVPMADDVVAERVAKQDYVREKTFDELQDERAAALQGRQERLQEQRRSLPIYEVRAELLQLIRDNQVVIIVGETGSGKTTQLLQYLYEDGLHLVGSGEEGRLSASSTPLPGDDTATAVASGEIVPPVERRLLCTQPRRIAAVSVAERVAQEVGSPCGSVVGYRVRFDDKTGPLTRILFLTDGMMLKEFTTDPDLSSVAAIMVDEAHERSLSTDILLGLLRDVVRRNSHLKVIVASATINADKFSNFFHGAPIFTVSGRTYPVDIFYAPEAVADYITESAQTVLGLHLSKPLPGDVLVFLPGQDTIEACAEMLQKYVDEAKGQLRPLLILPIYASLPPKEQARIYEQAPPGVRKVVIATNIAETSITIDGVVYVVDCGLCKQDFYNPQAMVEELRVVPTSQASATQRAGRAGRTQPGECYRLFTAYMFRNELPPETVPEILRCSMSSVVLQLKVLGIHNLLQFDFLDPPSTASLERALDHLYLLGAMKADGRLTVTGRRMAEFPMDPSFSKCLLRACAMGCGRHMAMAVSMLLLDSIFLNTRDPKEKQQIQSAKEHLFAFGNGDVAGYVRLMEEWLRSGPRGVDFCKTNGINLRSLLRARDVLDQILKIYHRVGLDVDTPAPPTAEKTLPVEGEDAKEAAPTALQINVEAITKAVLSGFFFNVARLEADKWSYVVVRPMDTGVPSSSRQTEQFDETHIAEIHPSSFLFHAGSKKRGRRGQQGGVEDDTEKGPLVLRERPPLIVFTQLRHTTKRFMTHVTAISSPELVLQMAPINYFDPAELETGLRKRQRQ